MREPYLFWSLHIIFPLFTAAHTCPLILDAAFSTRIIRVFTRCSKMTSPRSPASHHPVPAFHLSPWGLLEQHRNRCGLHSVVARLTVRIPGATSNGHLYRDRQLTRVISNWRNIAVMGRARAR